MIDGADMEWMWRNMKDYEGEFEYPERKEFPFDTTTSMPEQSFPSIPWEESRGLCTLGRPEYPFDVTSTIPEQTIRTYGPNEDVPEVHTLMPHHRRPYGFPVSRDWEDIDCRAVGCTYNRGEKCMVPSRCKIGADGRCTGFEAKLLKINKKPDGD